MASHGGVQTQIALLGSYDGSIRPTAGMWHIFIYYASLRSALKKQLYQYTRNTLSFNLLQGHQERVGNCSREVVLSFRFHGGRPDPVAP